MPKPCGNCCGCWRSRHAEPVVARASVSVYLAHRYAEELRHAGGAGANGLGSRPAVGRSVCLSLAAWRPRPAAVLGPGWSGDRVQAAGERELRLARRRWETAGWPAYVAAGALQQL